MRRPSSPGSCRPGGNNECAHARREWEQVFALSAQWLHPTRRNKKQKRENWRGAAWFTLPGLVAASIFVWTLLHETPASGLRTFLRLYTGAPRIIAPGGAVV